MRHEAEALRWLRRRRRQRTLDPSGRPGMSWHCRCSMCRGRLASQASAPAQAWLGMQWWTGLEGMGCMGIKNWIGSAWRCKGSISGPLPRSGARDRPRALPRSLADSCLARCVYGHRQVIAHAKPRESKLPAQLPRQFLRNPRVHVKLRNYILTFLPG